MKQVNYFIKKEKNSSEIVLIDYDKENGYQVNPKAKKNDAIGVNKIVFISPTLSEKLIRKKLDKKINSLLLELKTIDENDSDNGNIEKTLMDAEKLRIAMINNYVKYLGHTYHSLTLKKIQIIINELKIRQFAKDSSKRFFPNFEVKEEEKKGRGR